MYWWKSRTALKLNKINELRSSLLPSMS